MEDINSWTCQKCGHTGNKGQFCGTCGSSRPQSDGWTCPKCGKEGNKGHFCAVCGTPEPSGDMSKTQVMPNVQQQPIQQPLQQQPIQQPIQQPLQQPFQAQAAQQSTSPKPIIIGVVAAAAVIAFGAFIYFRFMAPQPAAHEAVVQKTEEQAPQDTSTQTPAPSQQGEAQQAGTQAMQVMILYHQRITARDYRGAYDLCTSSMQNTLGDFNRWKSGFTRTISSEAQDIHVTLAKPDHVEVTYTLVATDATANGTKVSRFHSTATLVKSGDRWLISTVKNKAL